MTQKLKVAVHKFASCDGCQLALLNRIRDLLPLSHAVEFVHFIEAGYYAPEQEVDVSFVEGSITTPEDAERIAQVRANSRYLITMGACATNGGIQALRNQHNATDWITSVYPKAEFIRYLDTSLPIKDYVKIDFELWGCPITSAQIFACLHALALGVVPQRDGGEKLCQACKRQQTVCVMVTRQLPCLGPITRTGCGALCPAFGRACYGCTGPDLHANKQALVRQFHTFGVSPQKIKNALGFIHSNTARDESDEQSL